MRILEGVSSKKRNGRKAAFIKLGADVPYVHVHVKYGDDPLFITKTLPTLNSFQLCRSFLSPEESLKIEYTPQMLLA